jgi:hypothetical protein
VTLKVSIGIAAEQPCAQHRPSPPFTSSVIDISAPADVLEKLAKAAGGGFLALGAKKFSPLDVKVCLSTQFRGGSGWKADSAPLGFCSESTLGKHIPPEAFYEPPLIILVIPVLQKLVSFTRAVARAISPDHCSPSGSETILRPSM